MSKQATRIKASELIVGDVMVEAPGATEFRGALRAAAAWSAVDAVKANATADAQRLDWPVGLVRNVSMTAASKRFPADRFVIVTRDIGQSGLDLAPDAAVYVLR